MLRLVTDTVKTSLTNPNLRRAASSQAGKVWEAVQEGKTSFMERVASAARESMPSRGGHMPPKGNPQGKVSAGAQEAYKEADRANTREIMKDLGSTFPKSSE